jgi:hypothetical protein
VTIFRPSPDQCRRVNIRLGGDGVVRDELAMAAAIGGPYAMVWDRRTRRWELDVPDPIDRAVMVMEGLILSRPFERANTATAMAIAALILRDAGLELILPAEQAGAWAELAAQQRSTLWLRTWLEKWIQQIAPQEPDE